jgi:hypothetical protein
MAMKYCISLKYNNLKSDSIILRFLLAKVLTLINRQQKTIGIILALSSKLLKKVILTIELKIVF